MKAKFLICAATASLVAPAMATTVSVNLTGGRGGPPGYALGASEVAGVVPAINWNNLSANADGNVSNDGSDTLLDSTGAATMVSVAWASVGPWAFDTSEEVGNSQMFNGYIDNFSELRTVTISGLDAGLAYSIYVYSDGDNEGNLRRGTFSMGGVTTEVIDEDGDFSGSFVEVPAGTVGAGNYTVFEVSGATTYDLDFQGITTDIPRLALNGLQIVSVPEPSSAVFSALGLLTLLRRRR
jgi:hypothetical protein